MELVARQVLEGTEAGTATRALAPDLSRVWFALEERAWSALLVVPARPGAEIRDLATSLLDVAVRASRQAPVLIDARGLTADTVRLRLEELEEAVSAERRAIVLVDSPLSCPPALALVRRCDAAVLCLDLRNTLMDVARETLELCGKDRFVGAVVVRGGGQ